jgi:hypothetical protein
VDGKFSEFAGSTGRFKLHPLEVNGFEPHTVFGFGVSDYQRAAEPGYDPLIGYAQAINAVDQAQTANDFIRNLCILINATTLFKHGYGTCCSSC